MFFQKKTINLVCIARNIKNIVEFGKNGHKYAFCSKNGSMKMLWIECKIKDWIGIYYLFCGLRHVDPGLLAAHFVAQNPGLSSLCCLCGADGLNRATTAASSSLPSSGHPPSRFSRELMVLWKQYTKS